MRRLLVGCVLVLNIASEAAAAGCTSAPPASAPQPSAVPTKQAELSKPPAASETTAKPAKTVEYPVKGKTISLIVPWAGGSVNDIVARFVASYLERELGVPMQVIDRPGAGSQTGITEVAAAKPDGYTLGLNSMPTTIILYSDPDRQAAFTRKDLQPVSVIVQEPVLVAVSADGPYKTAKDLVDAAKAAPEKVKVADSGLLTPGHLGWLAFAKTAGVKFASVHFNGDSECYSAVLGGHVDASVGYSTGMVPQVKSGKMRVLGVMDKVRSKYFSDVKTLPEQGYDVQMVITRGIVAPGGTAKEIVEILNGALARIAKTEEFNQKAEEAGLVINFLETAGYTAQWDEQEKTILPVLQEAKAQTK